jgi:hypothetical protein
MRGNFAKGPVKGISVLFCAVGVSVGLDEVGEMVCSASGNVMDVVGYASGVAVSSKSGEASDGGFSDSGTSPIVGGVGIGNDACGGGDCGGGPEFTVGAGTLVKR